MIKFLFDNFKDTPVIGDPIKGLYLGSLVKELVEKGKHSPAREELLNMSGDELEDNINTQATEMFDQNIGPVITQYNIPEQVATPVKEKAIEKLAAVLREKIQTKVDEKIG